MGIGGLRTYITIVPVSLVRHFSLQGGLSFPRSWGRFFGDQPNQYDLKIMTNEAASEECWLIYFGDVHAASRSDPSKVAPCPRRYLLIVNQSLTRW
jgi:hypothetical protein